MTTSGQPRVVLGVLALCLVQLVDVLGVTVVVSTLPRMLTDVGASSSAGALVATGYAMTFGGLLMFGARLGDRIGHRRTILISLLVFALGALTGATATTLLLLTIARCLQGAAAALAVPSALRLLTGLTSTEAGRARALAGWSAAGAVAGAAGFVIGGTVGALASWRWIFVGMLVVSALLSLMIIISVPSTGTAQPGIRLNLSSACWLTASVMAVVVATTLLPQRRTLVFGIALLGVGALAVWALRISDRRSPAPLLPAGVLRLPNLRRGTAAGFVNTATTGSTATLITLHLQDARGYSPFLAAAALLPFSVAVVAAAAIAPMIMKRIGRERAVALGLSLITVGVATVIIAPDRLWSVAGAMASAGLGIGVSSVAATSLGTDVDEAARATASGVINTAAQLGTALGTAALLLLANLTTGPSAPGGPAPRIGWLPAAVLAAIGAVAFFRLGRRPRVRPG